MIFKLSVTILLLMNTLVFSANATSTAENSFNVLSFNIRYNTVKDGHNAWPYRKQHVSSLIEFHQAEIVGLQEARLDQLADLKTALPKYDWYGLARDDGKSDSKGEYAAILYRKDKVVLNKQGTFWCSTTPEVPSKGWDSKYRRNINWGHFTQNDGKSFYFFNTHFDHKGKVAQAECAKILRQKIDRIAGKSPVIVTGDFNSEPTELGYKNLTDNQFYQAKLFDAAKTEKLKPYGPAFTAVGFDIMSTGGHTIDYILTTEDFTVKRFGVLTDSLDRRLPSDHYPLLIDVKLH